MKTYNNNDITLQIIKSFNFVNLPKREKVPLMSSDLQIEWVQYTVRSYIMNNLQV